MGKAQDLYGRLWIHLESCDWAALEALFTDDVEVIFQDARFRGLAPLLEYLRGVMQALPDLTHTITEVIENADGTALAGVVLARGTHAGNDPRYPNVDISGRSSEFHAADLLWLRGGRISKWWALYDVDERVASLGLQVALEDVGTSRGAPAGIGEPALARGGHVG